MVESQESIIIYLPGVELEEKLTISFDNSDPFDLVPIDKNVFSANRIYNFKQYKIQSNLNQKLVLESIPYLNIEHSEKTIFQQYSVSEENGNYTFDKTVDFKKFITKSTPVKQIQDYFSFIKLKIKDSLVEIIWRDLFTLVVNNQDERDQNWFIERMSIIPVDNSIGFRVFELFKLQEPFINKMIEEHTFQIDHLIWRWTHNIPIKKWLDYIALNLKNQNEENQKLPINEIDILKIFTQLSEKIVENFPKSELTDIKELLKQISSFLERKVYQKFAEALYKNEIMQTRDSQLKEMIQNIINDLEMYHQNCGEEVLEKFFQRCFKEQLTFKLIPQYLQKYPPTNNSFINITYSEQRLKEIPIQNRIDLIVIFSENGIILDFDMKDFFIEVQEIKKNLEDIIKILSPISNLYKDKSWNEIIDIIFSKFIKTTSIKSLKETFEVYLKFHNFIQESKNINDENLLKLIGNKIALEISSREFYFFIGQIVLLEQCVLNNKVIFQAIDIQMKNQQNKGQLEFINICHLIENHSLKENMFIIEMGKQAEQYLIEFYNQLKTQKLNLLNPFALRIIKEFPNYCIFKENVKNDLIDTIQNISQLSISQVKQQLLDQSQMINLIKQLSLEFHLEEIKQEINYFQIEYSNFIPYQVRFEDVENIKQISIIKDINYNDIVKAKQIFKTHQIYYNSFRIFKETHIFNKFLNFFQYKLKLEQSSVTSFQIIDCSLDSMKLFILSLKQEFYLDEGNTQKLIEKFLVPNQIVTFELFKQFVGQNFEEQQQNILKIFNSLESLNRLNINHNFKKEIEDGLKSLNQLEFFVEKKEIIIQLGVQFYLSNKQKENEKYIKQLNELSKIKYKELPMQKAIQLFNEFQESKIGLECQNQNEFELILQMEQIFVDVSKYQGENYFDLREFVEEDDFQTNTLLINLDKHKNCFTELISLKNNFLNNQQSYNYDLLLQKLIQLINQHMKGQKFEELTKCVDSFHKIEKLRGSINKKEQLGSLGQEIMKNGSFTFQISDLEVKLIIKRGNQIEITEQKVREIYSRVCVTFSNDGNLSEKDEQLRNLKVLWNDLQKIKGYLQMLLSYGNTQALDKDIIFDNSKSKFNQIQEKISLIIDTLHVGLKQWQQQLQLTLKTYPLLTLFGFKLYLPLIQLFEGNMKKDKVVLSILSHIGISPQQIEKFNSKTIQRQGDYKLADQLKIIGQFISNTSSVKTEKIMLTGSKIFGSPQKIFYYEVKQSQEILKVIQSLIGQTKKPEYFQFFFYQNHSTQTDIELFFKRYENLKILNYQQYFLIFPKSKVEIAFSNKTLELITNSLKQEQSMINNLYIISCEGTFLSSISLINTTNIDYTNLNSSSSIFNKREIVEFVHSLHPGEGKSFWIKNEISQKKYNSIRFPTYCIRKQKIIECIQQNSKYNCIHIDLYENPEIDIDFFLFEIIFLNSISIHSNSIVFINKGTKFYIEIANTLDNSLKESLYFKENRKQVHFSINDFSTKFMNSEQHLNASASYEFLNQFTDMKQINSQKPVISPQIQESQNKVFRDLLDKYFIKKFNSKLSTPCYYQVSQFINLFGSIMRKFSKSNYLDPNHLGIEGVRSDIVQMIYELSLRLSIHKFENKQQSKQNISKAKQMENHTQSIETIEKFEMSFVTFQEQEYPSITSFFTKKEQIPPSIQRLYDSQNEKILVMDDINIQTNPEILKRWLTRLVNQHGDSKEIHSSISIQRDNFFKIAIIFMNLSAGSSQILMGESGIGKTRLIQLLSELMEAWFEIFQVHAGIDEEDILKKMNQLITLSQKNPSQKYFIFFDEINTSSLVGGMFKEILQDRNLFGTQLPGNIIPLGAMNPYKLKSNEMREMEKNFINGSMKRNIHSLSTSDLQFNVFYPAESLMKNIKNFDKLSDDSENLYIYSIVQSKCLSSNNQKSFSNEEINQFSKMVNLCQKYLRNVMKSSSACSLRDVTRVAHLFFWFIDFQKKFIPNKIAQIDKFQFCLSLSLWIIFIVRLPKHELRNNFIKAIETNFKNTNLKIMMIVNEVSQQVSSYCDISKDIMMNDALNYNLLALLVSIQNKIPLILIGPPGSSKTLSQSIIIRSMIGQQSKSSFFRQFFAVMPLFYQGHVESTSKRILEVFENAKQKQKTLVEQKQDSQNILVIFFEEIGLAEISPHNPLKTLHPILENPEFSFVSVSNWPLDQSKMNRMMSVYRIDSCEDDLFKTMKSQFNNIIKNEPNLSVQARLRIEIEKDNYSIFYKIIRTYMKFLQYVREKSSKFEQFHGMRDFYGIIKTFYPHRILSLTNELKQSFTPEQSAVYAIQRHLQGHPEVNNLLPMIISENFDSSTLQIQDSQMIVDNLSEKAKDFTSRHLMVITPNVHIAIEFVKLKLSQSKSNKSYEVISGSGFEKDKGLDSSFEVLNKIINCVESGKVVILSNLKTVYQSIYELVNQNYRMRSNIASCQISLGSETNHVTISPKFKLVLIIPQDIVPLNIDGPLLNRFEKHYFDPLHMEEMKKINFNKMVSHFHNPKNPGQLFPFTNFKEVLANLIFINQDKQTSEIQQMMYHMSSFRAAITEVNDQNSQFFNQYIYSDLHFDYKSFIQAKLNSNQSDKLPKLFFITSLTDYIKNETTDFHIDLATISSSKILENKFLEFKNQLLNQNQEDTSILAITCSYDQREQILHTQEKITEWCEEMQKKSDSQIFTKQCMIVVIVKVKPPFEMIALINKWEYYHIEELFPQATQSELGKQINIKNLLDNQLSDLISIIDLEKIISEFLPKTDNIRRSFISFLSQVQESSDQNEKKLKQFLEIFTYSETGDYKQIQEVSVLIIQILVIAELQKQKWNTVKDFLMNYVFKQQKNSIGFSAQISNSVKQLVHNSLSGFMIILEDNNMVYSILESNKNKKKEEVLCQIFVDQLGLSYYQLTSNIPNQIISNKEDLIKSIKLHIKEKLTNFSQDLFFPLTPKLILHLKGLIERSFQEKDVCPNILIDSLKVEFPIASLHLFEIIKDYKLLSNKSDMFIQISQLLGTKYHYSGIPKDVSTLLVCLLHTTEIDKISAFLFTFNNQQLIDFNKLISQGQDGINSKHIKSLRDFLILIVNEISMILTPSNQLMSLIQKKSINYRDLLSRVLRFIDDFEIKEFCQEVSSKIYLLGMVVDFIELNTQLNSIIIQQFNWEKVLALDLSHFQSLYTQLLNFVAPQKKAEVFITLQVQKQPSVQEQTIHQDETLQKQKRFSEKWNSFLLLLLNSITELQSCKLTAFEQLNKLMPIIEFVEESQRNQNPHSLSTQLLPQQKLRINIIFKNLVSKIVKESSIIQFFQNSINIKLNNKTSRESASLLILSSIIQSEIIAPSFKKSNNEIFIQLLVDYLPNLNGTHQIQQAILLAIFRETVQLSKKVRQSGNEQLKSLFSKHISKEKPLAIYVLKQIYIHSIDGNIKKEIDDSFYLRSCLELRDFASKCDNLILLDNYELDLYKKFYDTKNQQSAIPKTAEVVHEILKTMKQDDSSYGGLFSKVMNMFKKQPKNAFQEIFNLEFKETYYYPFMMHNNIPLLQRIDNENNKQLYQCKSCKEFIFSDQCPNLQTINYKCMRCNTIISKLDRKVTNANQNLNELQKYIREQQWLGFYLNIQCPYFKLNEGQSLHFNLCAFVYYCSIYFVRQKTPYSEKNGEVCLINQLLKINYKIDAEQYMLEQINLLDTYIEEEFRLKSFNKQEQFINLIKIANQIIKDDSIVSTISKDDRVSTNIKICQKIDEILSSNNTKFQQINKLLSTLKESENLESNQAIQQGFMRSLRNAYINLQPNQIKDLWLRKFPNDQYYCLKYLLQLQKLEFVSEVLPTLITFAQMVTTNLSRKFSQKVGQDSSLLKLLKDDKRNHIYCYYVEKLLPAWNRILEVYKSFSVGCKQYQIQKLTEQTAFNELVFGSDKESSIFQIVLELLCETQNNIITSMENLCQQESKNQEHVKSFVLSMLRDSHTGQLKSKRLFEINPQFNILRNYNMDMLTHYAMNDVEYGSGNLIIDDLGSFSEKLISQIFHGVVIINLKDSPRFLFLKNALQTGGFSGFTIPQQIVKIEQIQNILSINSFELIEEILVHLSTLFQIFKSDSKIGNASICKKLKEIRINPSYSMDVVFPESLQLKHLISIIKELEINWMDKLVEKCHPSFLQPINKILFSQTIESLKKVKVDLNSFKEALGRFIIRTICQESSINPTGKLFEFFFYSDISSEFWEDPSILEKVYETLKQNEIVSGQSYHLFKETDSLLKQK